MFQLTNIIKIFEIGNEALTRGDDETYKENFILSFLSTLTISTLKKIKITFHKELIIHSIPYQHYSGSPQLNIRSRVLAGV